MDWKKIWIWVIVILIISAIVYFIRKGWRASQKCSGFKDSSCLQPNFSNVGTYYQSGCPEEALDPALQLEKGMHGCEVLSLQSQLNERLRKKCGNQLVPIEEDGRFGCETLGALQAVEKVANTTLNNI